MCRNYLDEDDVLRHDDGDEHQYPEEHDDDCVALAEAGGIIGELGIDKQAWPQ